ncbi:transmembrane protein 271-like [Latimeria chalumnae]|uniref:transmembrane protein 271-like n=1 Tax=Latimeria chalumnae TaxID=7897 RepID=UPI00313D80A2
MKLSLKGVCAILSSCLLFACALTSTAVGIKCFLLGSEVKEHFHLGTAAGAFYSGLLVCLGVLLLGSALVCCKEKPRSQNFFLLGVLIFMLGVLTAFAGAVIDGDTVALVERKYSHYCLNSLDLNPNCEKLRGYQKSLVISTIFNSLECLLGLINLIVVKNYKSTQHRRRRRLQRQSVGSILSHEEHDFSMRDFSFQPVSYINVGVFHVFDEAGVEVHCGGHPSLELPGYSPSDPELNHSYPYSYPLPNELPPPYEEIYPGETCSNT